MAELLQQLLDWIALNPIWAGIAIFLVAMCESLAVIGMLVPGAAMMIGFGTLISTGILEFWPTCGWAVAGAIVGDGLSFMLGHHYQSRISRLWPFNRHPQSLERSIQFFQRYGGMSVVIGRFVGPTRAIIPMIAGMMGMPANRFIIANVISALAWAPLYLLPGMVLGASLGLASEVVIRLVILLLLLVMLIWGIKQLLLFLYPRAAPWVTACLIILLALITSLIIWNGYKSEITLYAPTEKKRAISQSEWLNHAWHEQPAFRRSIKEKSSHPLYLQYAGTVESLKRALLNKGWQQANELQWNDLLKLLSPSLPLQARPVLPLVHDGRYASLTMIKPAPDDKRLVLRLWRSNTTLMPGNKILWVGSVMQQQQAHAFSLLHYAEISPDFITPMDALRADTATLSRKNIGLFLLLMESEQSKIDAAVETGYPAPPA